MRVLLDIAALWLSAAIAIAAEKSPVPPCGTTPVPNYAAVEVAPAVEVISGSKLAAWKPPSCVGW